VNQWKFGAAVALNVNGSNIVSAILQGAQEALSKVVLATLLDDKLRIDLVTPNDGTILNTGYRTNVTANSTVVFFVTVLAPLANVQDYGLPGYAQLRYVGFGSSVNVYSIMGFQCIGCSDTDPTAQVDLCHVCGGNNTACLGCDGLLTPPDPLDPTVQPKELDACGLCGGNGQTCVDCNNVTNGGNQTDICGVCGGNGASCLGCDGIPYGAALNSCGMCGQPNSACTASTVVIALVTTAAIGIVIAAAALLFLIGEGAVMARADAALFEEEAVLQDNPLYEEAKRKFDNPLYQNQ